MDRVGSLQGIQNEIGDWLSIISLILTIQTIFICYYIYYKIKRDKK